MLHPLVRLGITSWIFATALLFNLLSAMPLHAAGLDAATIPGVVVDDVKAEKTGEWKPSTHTKPFVGEGYVHAAGGQAAAIVFTATLDESGVYEVLIAYTAGGNRADKVAVTVETPDGPEKFVVNQKESPQGFACFHRLGSYRFEAGDVKVTIGAEETNGAVIADAVAFLTEEQLKLAVEKFPAGPKLAVSTPLNANTPATEAKPAPPAAPQAPPFAKLPASKPLTRLTPQQLDGLLDAQLGGVANAAIVDDEGFLRRVTLDLVGRPPTLEELDQFMSDTSVSAEKRSAAVNRLLASADFGANWANYWSDVISYRTPQPELTFLNYQTLKNWLAAEFNRGTTWDEIVYHLLTATGKVAERPAATFIGFHQADKSRLAAETTRVFLGTQIQCAECHDHKFMDMPQETFHHFAAFFVRTDAKLPWNVSDDIEVKSKDKGEHKMPGGKDDMQPVAFGQAEVTLGKADLDRRVELARWVVGPENPWFARAYVNRLWARLMGRGFCEPVDEIGELSDPVLPEIHAAVAEHFAASGFDMKDLVQLITATRAYARALPAEADPAAKPFAVAVTGKLRGDEVFASLATAVSLPNVTPPQGKADGNVRFPPPPKSTRDLVNDAFGFDPSVAKDSVLRTMKQAMFLMNNKQLQQQIEADGGETMLTKLLAAESDNGRAVEQLFRRVLARQPTADESKIALEHIASLPDRTEGFEDLLWSLVNSAEFTTRK